MKQQAFVRVGVLVPQGNTVHEREFDRLRPDGVEFKFLGFSYPQDPQDFCVDLIAQMAPALQGLRAWNADLVLVGCTTASIVCGGESFSQSLETIAETCVVTAASAAREAMTAMRIDTVSVATPYGVLNNGVVADFLKRSGVTVAALEGLDLDRTVEAWIAGQASLTPQRVFDLCRAADRPQAQGIFLPCTGMGSLDAIDRFEASTGKPAFSSVQAGFWASLKRLGVNGRCAGAGQLLQLWDF